jgi:phosphoribosylanthranilate isomerase
MTWVKICGTTNLADAEAAVAAGADALGFIFAESPRRIAPADARAIIERLPNGVEKIGVFVDEDFERVWQIVDEAGLTAVQLHGHETPRGVRRMLAFRALDRPFEPRPKIFKAIPVGGDPYAGSRYVNGGEEMLAGVLLDTGGGRAPGGTGVAFDWKKNAEFVFQLGQRFRLILAGGLDPQNVSEAIATLHPWGVDVVSGVEREPGKKDPEKVKAFVKAAKCAQ